MSGSDNAVMAKNVDDLERLLSRQVKLPEGYVEEHAHLAEEGWVPANGARLVVRAWTDPSFKQRLLEDGLATAKEMGFTFPSHHSHLVILENTPEIHNVICCSLCSCTALSLIGMAPGWYKSVEYRARIVREARAVLKELGLELPSSMKVKVWDTTTDTRYMVLPYRPEYTRNWTEEQLMSLIDQDSLVGIKRLEPPFSAPRTPL